MPWTLIIEAIIEVIANCRNSGRSRDAIRESIKDPGPFDRLTVRRAVRRKLGWSRREWRRRGPETLEQVFAMSAVATDGDIDALIQEADELGEFERREAATEAHAES